MKRTSLVSALVVVIVGASSVRAQTSYKREIPDSLARRAKVDETAAAAVAQKRFPTGVIQAVELEQEKGSLIYSYELKIPGRSGVEEVNVNAMTGKMIAVEHESTVGERKEADDEAKAEKKVAKPKKP